jgi:hypothetical protein
MQRINLFVCNLFMLVSLVLPQSQAIAGTAVTSFSTVKATTISATNIDANKVRALVDVGEVKAFFRVQCPTGYLPSNGSSFARATYPDLWTVCQWAGCGVGNGSTTFTTPDLRGEFLRGIDSNKGTDPDYATRSVGSVQADTMQLITGSFAIDDRQTLATGAFQIGDWGDYGSGSTGSGNAVTFDSSRVARTSTETRPHNVAVLYCIRY